MIKKQTKRGQQEILGFVIIVVLIVVVGVIFLGISLRKGMREDISTADAEISNFLEATSKYTTDCILDKPIYAEIGGAEGLIEGCYSQKKCLEEEQREACSVLNKTYTEILDKLWPAGENRPITYRKLTFFYQTDLEDINTRNVFLEIEAGNRANCKVLRAGRQLQARIPGVELTICSQE